MNELQPGWVKTMTGQLVRIEAGQRWGYFKAGENGNIPLLGQDNLVEYVLPLTVISISPEGMVVLRPNDPQKAEKMFPLKETTFKGKTVHERTGCPFSWADERAAKGSNGEYQAGDLLVNAAWTIWRRNMHMQECPLKPEDRPFRVEKL
jgi:hypothetical protein